MPITGLPKNWDELPRDEKIFHEEKRLEKILKDVPKQQIALCRRLIERAAFMLVIRTGMRSAGRRSLPRRSPW